jgi:Icc-related predicted phosphoesterase
MLLVSDVHGAWEPLAAVAATAAETGEPLLVLGDLVNLVDYRTMDGILSEVVGKPTVREVSRLRLRGDHATARERWQEASAGRKDQVQEQIATMVSDGYARAAAALAGCEAYVTYGNVDDPVALAEHMPDGVRFVDGDVVAIDGVRVGFAGGGIGLGAGAPGTVTEERMAAKLAGLGEIDVLCTHAAPAVRQLSYDVVAGAPKGSTAVLDFIAARRPVFHYFGDVHQPQALAWRVGATRCRNVGYFRATRRPVRHG